LSEDMLEGPTRESAAGESRPWERRFLALCGSREVSEVSRDLDEEARQRRASGASGWRIALWRARQVLLIGLYDLRDIRLRRRRRRIHPRLAVFLAFRSLWRGPGLPTAAALTLGLGFGAAAAIYGVYSGFGRSIPVPDGAGVRRVRILDDRGRPAPLGHDDLEVLQATTTTFESLGGFATSSATVRGGEKHAVPASVAAMTPEVFELLRVAPANGRHLVAADEGAVVVSDDFWTSYLGADEAVLGSTLRIDGMERVVVGVMPAGHRFPFNQDLWTVIEPGWTGSVEAVARLADGVEARQAGLEVERTLEGLRATRGAEVEGLRVEVLGFTEKRGEAGEGVMLATVLALVVALVLVSCSNVSNLLFARALARVDVLAVHAALGAGPTQVALQMLAEALLIALAGALVGLGAAAAAIHYIESTLAGHWGYYWMAVRFEWGVVLFTLTLAVATGLISGVMPALRLWRSDLGEVLRSDASGVIGGSRRRVSTVLLNGQVAFSCFALVVAILLASGLLRSQVADGFPAEDIFVAGMALESAAYDEPDRRRAFRDSLLEALRSSDDVGVAALSNAVPGLTNSVSSLEVEGASRDPEARPEIVVALAVTPSYFDILGARLLSGRTFAAAGASSGEGVVVVSETFVREHLRVADALGLRMRLERITGPDWLRIVGVVADVPEYEGADSRALARAYVPFAAVEPREAYVLYTGVPSAGTAAVRAAIADLDPDVAVTGVFGQQSETRVADIMSYVRRIYQTGGILAMLGGFGAAVVALIGLYGALAFEVERRVPEIGVRMALGAAGSDVVRHLTRTGLTRVAPGLLLGLLMSVGISPLLGVLLGQMNPFDMAIHLGVYLAYLAVAVVATVVPGRRAARLDPVNILRSN